MSTVLCVEDDSTSTDLLHEGLTQAGFTVLAACDSAQALDMVTRLHPDLVLVDPSQLDKDGLDLCSCLRTDLEVPFIMVTACTDDIDIVAGFEQGADDYVAKPLHLGILIRRIEAVLRYT